MSVLSNLFGKYGDDIAKAATKIGSKVDDVASVVANNADDIARLSAPRKAANAINNRLSGDKLLDATDLIDEIRGIGGTVDDFGNVKLFHRTTPEAAKQIQDTGKMFGKENGLFFSTAKNGVNNSQYGKGLVEMDIPVENLMLDDIFDDEASIRLPLDRAGQYADVSDFISKPNDSQIMKIYRGQNGGIDDLLYNNPNGVGSALSRGDAYHFTPTKSRAGTWSGDKGGVIEIPMDKSNAIMLQDLLDRANEADKIFSDSRLAEQLYNNNPSEYELIEALAERRYKDISELTGKPFIQPDSDLDDDLMEILFFPQTNPELTRQYRDMLKGNRR